MKYGPSPLLEQQPEAARWIWWLTEVTLLKDGKVDVAHARAAFDSTATDPYHAQITPEEYASGELACTRFAAYDDLAIYAVGASPEAVIAKARADAREPNAEFKVALVTAEFAAWIEENGWNGNQRSFEITKTGFLRDTTD